MISSRHKEEDLPLAKKKFFSTGEAARLLNISRSTVSRKFDNGILQGKKNPITGERLISHKSLEALIKQYDLRLPPQSLEKKRLLVASSDKLLTLLIQKNFSRDDRFEVQKVALGSDAMAYCSKTTPDLVVIDEELPDTSCHTVVKYIKQTVQKALKTICYSKTHDAEKCMKCKPDEIFTKGALNEDSLLQKIQALVDLHGRPPYTHAFEHQRRWPRIPVNLPANIGVYPKNEPHLRYFGKATVKNISHGGAFLSSIRMDEGIIPSDPFRLVLEVDTSPLENWRAECKVVRLHSDAAINAGVQFLNVSGADLQKVETMAAI